MSFFTKQVSEKNMSFFTKQVNLQDEIYRNLSHEVGTLQVDLYNLEKKVERGYIAFLKLNDPIPNPIGWTQKTSWFYATLVEKKTAIASFETAEKEVNLLRELIQKKIVEGKEMFHKISLDLRFSMIIIEDRFVN